MTSVILWQKSIKILARLVALYTIVVFISVTKGTHFRRRYALGYAAWRRLSRGPVRFLTLPVGSASGHRLRGAAWAAKPMSFPMAIARVRCVPQWGEESIVWRPWRWIKTCIEFGILTTCGIAMARTQKQAHGIMRSASSGPRRRTLPVKISCAAWYSAKCRRLTASSRTSVLFFGSGPDGSAGAGASRSRYGSVRKPLRQSVGIGRGALPWTVRCEAMRGARGRWVAFDAYLDSRRCLHAQSSELSDAPARAPPCNVHPQPRRAHGNAREASSAHS